MELYIQHFGNYSDNLIVGETVLTFNYLQN